MQDESQRYLPEGSGSASHNDRDEGHEQDNGEEEEGGSDSENLYDVDDADVSRS